MTEPTPETTDDDMLTYVTPACTFDVMPDRGVITSAVAKEIKGGLSASGECYTLTLKGTHTKVSITLLRDKAERVARGILAAVVKPEPDSETEALLAAARQEGWSACVDEFSTWSAAPIRIVRAVRARNPYLSVPPTKTTGDADA